MPKKGRSHNPHTIKIGLDRDIYGLDAIREAQRIYRELISAELTITAREYVLKLSFRDKRGQTTLKNEFLNHILGLSARCH